MATKQNLPEVLVIDDGTAFESGLRGGDSRVTVTTSSTAAMVAARYVPLGRTAYVRSDLLLGLLEHAQTANPVMVIPADVAALHDEITNLTQQRDDVTVVLGNLQREHNMALQSLRQAESMLAGLNARKDTQPEHPAG